jgi:hypothetical protein
MTHLAFQLGRGKAGMSKFELYRHYAAECIRLAQQLPYPPEKDMLLSMAAAWRRLAEHAENAGRQDTGGERRS